jgi:hypothetical protein
MTFFGPPDMFIKDREIDRVHISVSFTYDKNYAEWLAEQWMDVAPVEISGPAYGIESDVFIPGIYLDKSYIITSRGCINRCWFCNVWKREKGIKELPITDGWILQDDNILGCSENHIRDVFSMFIERNYRPNLRGIEAKLLKDWHIDLFVKSRVSQIWCANDEQGDLEPLIEAGKKLRSAGFNKSVMCCYCLIGYPKDTMIEAEKRLKNTYYAGFMPFAMLWKNENGDEDKEWRKMQRLWARPTIIESRMKEAHPCAEKPPQDTNEAVGTDV